jgi:hypothetical protein
LERGPSQKRGFKLLNLSKQQLDKLIGSARYYDNANKVFMNSEKINTLFLSDLSVWSVMFSDDDNVYRNAVLAELVTSNKQALKCHYKILYIRATTSENK